jgi:hypothetical protein
MRNRRTGTLSRRVLAVPRQRHMPGRVGRAIGHHSVHSAQPLPLSGASRPAQACMTSRGRRCRSTALRPVNDLCLRPPRPHGKVSLPDSRSHRRAIPLRSDTEGPLRQVALAHPGGPGRPLRGSRTGSGGPEALPPSYRIDRNRELTRRHPGRAEIGYPAAHRGPRMRATSHGHPSNRGLDVFVTTERETSALLRPKG